MPVCKVIVLPLPSVLCMIGRRNPPRLPKSPKISNAFTFSVRAWSSERSIIGKHCTEYYQLLNNRSNKRFFSLPLYSLPIATVHWLKFSLLLLLITMMMMMATTLCDNYDWQIFYVNRSFYIIFNGWCNAILFDRCSYLSLINDCILNVPAF